MLTHAARRMKRNTTELWWDNSHNLGVLPWLDTGPFVRTGLDRMDGSYLLFICGRAARTHGAMPRDG